MKWILGISAFYHDSAAALLRDGEIVAAAQEERFTRKKNDESFPENAVAFCLRHAGIDAAQLDAVAFYDKPIVKFGRMLETFLAVAPLGASVFVRSLPSWLQEKLNVRRTLALEIPGLRPDCAIRFTQHHEAHAASAFFPSPFGESAVLTVDGVGEWATTTVGRGCGDQLELLSELRFPHSLGLLYSAFTAYCGFRVNSGEYKLMGLAPYGEPRFAAVIRERLIDLRDDGSFRLNMEYFEFLTRWDRMTGSRFDQLFGGGPRPAEGPLEQRFLDIAASIQQVTNDAMLALARQAKQATGLRHLCLAGGVALNCVANGVLQRSGLFDEIWIQPAAGDAGGALGAALAVAAAERRNQKPPARAQNKGADAMQGAFLGPGYTDEEIRETLDELGARYEHFSDDALLLERTVELLIAEKVVGWFQGRMEFGPRALGNRSILGDARSPRMQSVMNLKVKFRESFRPFAPAVLRERAAEYFELTGESPYMLVVAPVRETWRKTPGPATGLSQLKEERSIVPAVTHVDFSARVQTVSREGNPRLHALLKRFEARTGCPMLVNTSFNVRGEPVVCTPADACRCFASTEMDWLVLGNFLLERTRQPASMARRGAAFQPD